MKRENYELLTETLSLISDTQSFINLLDELHKDPETPSGAVDAALTEIKANLTRLEDCCLRLA